MAEVTVATVEAEKLGRIPLMLTLAPNHKRGTRIRAGLDRIDAVFRAVMVPDDKSMRARWRQRWAIREYFTARECTLGGYNGAHPHAHLLVFVDPLTAPGVAELLEEFEAAGYDDARVARELPYHLAQAVQDEFVASMEAWAEQRPKNGVSVDDPAVVAERRRRRKVIDGWTAAGVQCVPAGVGAAKYLAKLAVGMTEDELRIYATLTGMELTNASAAKEGGVSTTTAMATLGGEWAESVVKVRRQRIRRWVAADDRRRTIAEGFSEWRDATRGEALLMGSPGYYKLLPTTWERLDDGDIVARAGEVVTADKRRRELWRQQQEAVAAADAEGEGEVEADPDDQADDDEWKRTVYVDPLVAAGWAGDGWDDERAGLMGLHDEQGPWGMVVTLAVAWAATEQADAYVHERDDGALRVGRHAECWRDGCWRVVAADELAGRWTPPGEEIAA